MSNFTDKSEILRRIEFLQTFFESSDLSRSHFNPHISEHETTPSHQDGFDGKLYLEALFDMVEKDQIMFGRETWHALEDSSHSPAEMLLRLHTENKEPLPPYPFIMRCYEANLTAELDLILFLKGLREFRTVWRDKGETQASINISARSLKNPDFVGIALNALEEDGSNIVFEIHETSDTIANHKTFRDFRKKGVRFALDDVILNVSDMMRLSHFDGLTSFMKLDHKLLNDQNYKPLLGPTLSFISSSVKNSRVVAEGVRTVEDAQILYQEYPDIKFVQGRHLPEGKVFSKSWKKKPKQPS